jgi:SAM-dependent methyltransferase
VTRSDGTGSESLSCYTNQYFSALETGVIPSARVIVPLVLGLVRARSVIDIGCGRGAWLKVFRENGVTDIHGMDGSHVDPESLLIDPSEFTAADLARPFTIARTYDLAVCLEVAEHLPAAAAPALVRELTRAAPVVLFSAAIPGQQGLGHVNEQWPMYWSRLFESHGFSRLDPIRREIWQDARVLSFYRQNVVLFASAQALAASPRLSDEACRDRGSGMELISAGALQRLGAPLSARDLLRQLPGAIVRAVKRRVIRGCA